MSDETEVKNIAPGFQLLMGAAAFVIVIGGLKAAGAIVVPFLLAAFIAIISAPFLFVLKERGFPTWAALLIVGGIIFGFFFVVATLITTSINDFLTQFPTYEARIADEIAKVSPLLEKAGVNVSRDEIKKLANPGSMMAIFTNTLTSLGAVLTNGFMIMLTTVFMLLEASSFPAKLSAVFGHKLISGRGERIVRDIKRYMAIKTMMSLLTGTVICIWLWILGISYPMLWGLLAFLLNYVPSIGSFIAAVPAVIMAFVQFGFMKAGLAALGYVFMNVVVENMIELRFMGRGLGLSTLVVFLSLVFWGWVLGPVGMLLSLPLTMTVKIALEASEETRWIAVLLGSDTPKVPRSTSKASIPTDKSAT